MSTTRVVLTACLLTIVLWDLITVLRNGVGCSVSRCLQRGWYGSPIVQFGCGAIFGHLFLYLDPGQSVISLPEKTNVVTTVYIRDMKMTAVFVPDGIEINFEQPKEKLEPYPDPISTQ